MELEEIKEKLRKLKPYLEKEFGVKYIGIFGSFVRGEERKDSDLDILVEFDESAEPSLLDFIRLENYLSDTLGVKIDLVERKALKPRIGEQILKEVVSV